jgi:hypothetical protein
LVAAVPAKAFSPCVANEPLTWMELSRMSTQIVRNKTPEDHQSHN